MRGSFGVAGNHRSVSADGNFNKHVFFTLHERGSVVAGHFKAVTVGNGISRTCLHTEPAENAPIVIDIVNAGVALTATDSNLICILSRLDVDAGCRAGSSTEETCNALFHAVFITLQFVDAPETFLKLGGLVGIVFGHGGRHHLLHRDGHAFGNGRSRADYITQIRHTDYLNERLFVIQLVNKGENVESLDFPIREETVDCIELFFKYFEDGIESRHHQKFDVATVDVDQFGHAPYVG